MNAVNVRLVDVNASFSCNFWRSDQISQRSRQKGLQYAAESYFQNIFISHVQNTMSIEGKCHRSQMEKRTSSQCNIQYDVNMNVFSDQHCSCNAGKYNENMINMDKDDKFYEATSMAGFNVFRIFGFHIDFFTDRLFRIYSFLLFLILAVSLAWEFRYNGLHCFTPMHFSSRMAVYADIVCGQSSKLYESSLDKLPRHHEHESEIHRYFNMNKMRYLPVVLTGQSLLFLLPWLFWKLVSGGCCSLQGLVNDSAKMTTSNDPKTGRTITSELLKLQSSGTSIVFVLSYLLSKAMYWAICLLQMGILAKFLDINFFKYRYSTHMYDSYDVRTTGNDTESVFPRIVLCGFEVQRLGSFQRYTVECAVPMSEVMERYLYIIWAWIITLAVLIAISGILYFLKSIFWLIGPKSYKNSFIKRKLNDINQAQSVSQTVVDKFGDLYLKPGTFLAFEILEENGSLHAVSMAVNHMWEEFLKTAKLGDDVVEIPERTGPSYTYTPMVEMGSGDVQAGPTGAQSKPGPYHSVQEDLKNV